MSGIKLTASLLLSAATMANAQFATNWVAFNDHNLNNLPGPTTAPNTTLYNLAGLTNLTAGSTFGPLTNFLNGQELNATLSVSWTGGDGPDNFGASFDPDADSPADQLFNGIVDVGGIGVGIDEGIPGVRTSEGNIVTMTFSNLDPSQRYLFRGTSVRGNNYNDRWAVYTIHALSFVDAHVDASANLNIFTGDTFPASGLTSGMVAINSGENRVGSLVGWNDIVPFPDGTFTITEEQYAGTAPFGNPSAGPYGYGMGAIMLAEIFTGPPSAPIIVTQPSGVTNSEGQVAFVRVVASGTPPLNYQWYQGTPPGGTAIPNATRATLSVTNMAGSGKAWSVPADSGTYYVTINGALAPPVTSLPATVQVNPDTTPPAFLYATCSNGNAAVVFVTLSEAVDNTDGRVVDPFGWNVRDLESGIDINIFEVAYVEGSTNITITMIENRDPSRAYQVNYVGADPLIDRSAARNAMPNPSSMPLNCFETELVSMTAEWRYQDDDIDPGPGWFSSGFDDSTWSVGPGHFDAKRDGVGSAGQNCRDAGLYNLGNVGTCINLTSPVTATNLVTAYFRTRFQFGGTPSTTILQLNGKFDDGAVVYLNGIELERVGMPAAPTAVGHGTFAPRSVGDGDPQDIAQFIFPAALRAGENQLAVSLHQNSLTSSDLTMGLRVVALTRTLPNPPGPRLTITREGSNVRIRWTPVTGRLQFSDTLSANPTWQIQTTGEVTPGDYLIPANQARRFYTIGL